MNDKYILEGTTVVPVEDIHTWAHWFETADRVVAQTWITEDMCVSTVFLGLDHQWGDGPPLLFETMVFLAGSERGCTRTSTWHEAEQEHQRVVESLQ